MLHTTGPEPALGVYADNRTVDTSWEAMDSPVPLSFNLQFDSENTRTSDRTHIEQPLHNRAQIGRFNDRISYLDDNRNPGTSAQNPDNLNPQNGYSNSTYTSLAQTADYVSNYSHTTTNAETFNLNQEEVGIIQILNLENQPEQENNEQQGNPTSHQDSSGLQIVESQVTREGHNDRRLETIRDVSDADDSRQDINSGTNSEFVRNREVSNGTSYQDSVDDADHIPPLVGDYTNDINQKTLLDLMTRGFRTFTCEMADVIIDKLNPEYEALARKVGEEVKCSTANEIKELREIVKDLQSKLQAKESENIQLKDSLEKLKLKSKLELEKEVLKREQLTADQSAIISGLQSDIEKLQNTKLEREKWVKKADLKAKMEEKKRIQIEEDYSAKIKDLQKQLDKFKGDLLVKKSVRRIKASSAKEPRSGAITRILMSHHGPNRNRSTTYVHLPYQEGDP